MKLPCEVIEDLLILYDEDACSEESRRLVEEHLTQCQACSGYLKNLSHTEELLVTEVPQEAEEETQAVKSGFDRIRRRWRRTLLVITMLFPVLGILVLGVNEFRGEGIAFSNLDDIYRCRKYLYYLEKKEFEKAAECVNYSAKDYGLIDSVKDMSEEEFEQYMKVRFVKKLQEYDTLGLFIDGVSFDMAYRSEDGWNIEFEFTENYPDGSKLQKAGVSLDGEDLLTMSINRPGNSNRALYLTEALYLWIEDDPLGYQEKETSFVLEEGQKATISWRGIQNIDGDVRDIALINKDFGTIFSATECYFRGESIEAMVPGEYALLADLWNGQIVNLGDIVEIEILSYDLQ